MARARACQDIRIPMNDGSYGASRTSSQTRPCSCRARGLIWQRRRSVVPVGVRRTISSRCRRCANVTCLPAANGNSLHSSRGLSSSFGDRAPRRVASRGVTSRSVALSLPAGETKKKETRRCPESAKNRSPLSHSGNCQCHLLLANVSYLISRTCHYLFVSLSLAPAPFRPSDGLSVTRTGREVAVTSPRQVAVIALSIVDKLKCLIDYRQCSNTGIYCYRSSYQCR